MHAIENLADPARSQTFGYDSLSRLTAADGAYGLRNYTYDAVGNRLSESRNDTADTYSYAAGSHRLQGVSGATSISLAYDADHPEERPDLRLQPCQPPERSAAYETQD